MTWRFLQVIWSFCFSIKTTIAHSFISISSLTFNFNPLSTPFRPTPGIRRRDRGARHAFRRVLQRLYPHHAASPRQPHPLDIRPRRGRRGTRKRRRDRRRGPIKRITVFFWGGPRGVRICLVGLAAAQA